MTIKEAVKRQYEHELQEKLDTYIRLVEVSKRTIATEEQQIKNYEAQIDLLRAVLEEVKAQWAEEAHV